MPRASAFGYPSRIPSPNRIGQHDLPTRCVAGRTTGQLHTDAANTPRHQRDPKQQALMRGTDALVARVESFVEARLLPATERSQEQQELVDRQLAAARRASEKSGGCSTLLVPLLLPLLRQQ